VSPVNPVVVGWYHEAMTSHPFLVWLAVMPALFVIDALYHRFTKKQPVGFDLMLHFLYIFLWPIGIPLVVAALLFMQFGAVSAKWSLKAWYWLSTPTPPKPSPPHHCGDTRCPLNTDDADQT
jgi:hypothetical protein